jgi:LuxR family maltose regulon positive regulatory protein
MREPSPMPGDKNLGVTLSRTLIPTLPAGYLSRKRLFPLIDNKPGGTTFVIAPGGYGKSSLIAEWAQYQDKGVIWVTLTNNDTTNEMSAMLITATRHVIPGFAPWFEKEQPLRPTQVVQRWGNELLESGKEFVFVIDNLRNENERDVEIAIKLVEHFPKNIHFIAIRRDEISELYATSASRGMVKVISLNDLRFTEEEIEHYAINSGLEFNNEIQQALSAANGWPAAVSLLLAQIQFGVERADLVSLMGRESEPLRALAMVVIKNLDKKISNICEKLSVLESFDLNQAQVILEEDYSYELINSIALEGEIFTLTRNAKSGYVFSPMVRQIFLEGLRKRPDEKLEIHKRLIPYFENLGRPSAAIQHAFEAGDAEKISELFPNAARVKQAQGLGGDLHRWSALAGDTSTEGELKKSTVRTAAFLADLDFRAVYGEVTKIQLLADSSPRGDFFKQFADGALAYALLSVGKFQEVEESIKSAKVGEPDCYLGLDDQINLLRALCVKRYIWNDAEGVEEIFNLAQELGKKTSLYTSHTFLLSIQAMHFHQRGEYRRAHEIAQVALEQHLRHGFVGNHGPLDAMFVIARCLFEFTRPQEALAIFEQIRNYSSQWKQWHWYLTSDKHIVEFLSYNSKQQEGLERIKNARDFIATLDIDNRLAELIDVSEMPVRRRLLDFDRLEKLVNRAPRIRDTQQYRMAVDEYRGRKTLAEDAKKLPEKTPRDLIWKHLMDVSLHADAENIALPAMRKALMVGAEVGARETFLRQRDEMANYIIKVANDFPTVYNEELATAMAQRIKERGTAMTTSQQSLTKRELEILRHLSTGRTLTVIAGELHISQNTMKTHLKNLYKKMGAEGRHDAVEKAKSTFLI